MGIVFRNCKIKLKPFCFRREGCEIVAARGRIDRVHHPIYTICVYIPPRITKCRLDTYKEVIHDLLSKIKAEERDPYVIIAGDINKHNINDSIEDFLDIQLIPSPPTRGNECLDLIYTNAVDAVRRCDGGPPLESNNGTTSDHDSLIVSMSLPHRHSF